MKTFILLSIVSLAFARPNVRSPAVRFTDVRIIGGEEAPKHEFPWQISLRQLGSHICGGSLINDRQIISAAHCVKGQVAAFDSVVCGAHNRILEGGHQKRNIAKMEAHDNFNFQDLGDDVSIITVSEPFDLSDPNCQPIEMFRAADTAISVNTVCNTTGWGLTSGGGLFPPNALQWVQIPVISEEECKQKFGDVITDGMICAGGPGAGSCNGDSGGPFVCPDSTGNGKLAGIVSFGVQGCKDSTVYTKVSHYEDWIVKGLKIRYEIFVKKKVQSPLFCVNYFFHR